jgi:hypothetical protein
LGPKATGFFFWGELRSANSFATTRSPLLFQPAFGTAELFHVIVFPVLDLAFPCLEYMMT